jgi:sporulation protein YlmC with PRC-barrel domain
MTTGRSLWAGLHLLDRQMLDRDGRMAGCVDDLELAYQEGTRQLHVTAILSGPGALAQRLGRRRYGGWMRRVHALASPTEGDPARITFQRVSDIGDHVTLAADREDLGSASAERWVRDHIVDHIPGSGHAPE